MKKLFLALGIAAVTASAVSAQTVVVDYDYDVVRLGTYERVSKHGPYLTGRFFDNMFIGIAGGVNIYGYNSGNNAPDFGDRLAPSIDAYIGKWFTPTVGVRIGYNGLKSKGYSPVQPQALDAKDHLRTFNTMFIHGDFMWNISNAIGGYNEHRFWDFVPYVGFGYARAWEEGMEENKIAGTAGLLNNLRISPVVDITIDARYMLVDETFDGMAPAGGKKFENMCSLTAGLTFKFGPKGGFKRPVYNAPADYTPYERRISTLEADVARQQAANERLNRELQAEKSKPKTVEVEVEKVFTPVTISSFFGIGNAQPTQKEIINLKAVADAIKSQPRAKFNVTGYADAGTGTPQRNMELSQMRADNVANVLVNTYGVNRSQLIVKGMGGVNKHPNDPALDRVVVID